MFGSGRRGQTYLFWRGDQLLELPVSYWTELDDWINSPGFPDGSPRFDKPVLPRCLECHSGRFEALPQSENSYDPGSLVLGITCEKLSRSRPRTRAFSRFKDCRKLWNARSNSESRVTSARPANRYLCSLSCRSRQASRSCPILHTGSGVGGLRAHSVPTRRCY